MVFDFHIKGFVLPQLSGDLPVLYHQQRHGYQVCIALVTGYVSSLALSGQGNISSRIFC